MLISVDAVVVVVVVVVVPSELLPLKPVGLPVLLVDEVVEAWSHVAVLYLTSDKIGPETAPGINDVTASNTTAARPRPANSVEDRHDQVGRSARLLRAGRSINGRVSSLIVATMSPYRSSAKYASSFFLFVLGACARIKSSGLARSEARGKNTQGAQTERASLCGAA
jgi:hypothetical protein